MSTLRLGYTGFVVEDVAATVAFYGRAFGLAERYAHPSGGYAELETGATMLAFVGEAFLASTDLFGTTVRPNRPELPPIGAQVAFVTEDIEADWQSALAAGATILSALSAKPWGQISGYLADPNGIVVELCTPSAH